MTLSVSGAKSEKKKKIEHGELQMQILCGGGCSSLQELFSGDMSPQGHPGENNVVSPETRAALIPRGKQTTSRESQSRD